MEETCEDKVLRCKTSETYSVIGGILMGITARYYLTKLGFKDKVTTKHVEIALRILKSTVRKLEDLLSDVMLPSSTLSESNLDSDEFENWLNTVDDK